MPEVDPSLGPRAATRRLALLGGSAPMYLRAREVHSLVAATHSHVRPQCILAANAPRAHTHRWSPTGSVAARSNWWPLTPPSESPMR